MPTRQFNARLPEEIWELIERLQVALNCPQSSVVTIAVRQLAKNELADTPKATEKPSRKPRKSA